MIKLLKVLLKNEIKVENENLKFIKEIDSYNLLGALYKENLKSIYFLIIYQKEFDINLSYKILNICVNIINNSKNKKFHRIIPFVICPQNKEYKNQIDNEKIKMTTCEKNCIDLNYNLINMNKKQLNKQMKCTVIGDFMGIESLKV